MGLLTEPFGIPLTEMVAGVPLKVGLLTDPLGTPDTVIVAAVPVKPGLDMLPDG